MPDYNSNGFDDFTGQYVGFGSRSKKYEQRICTESPKKNETDACKKQKVYRKNLHHAKALALQNDLHEWGFNQTPKGHLALESMVRMPLFSVRLFSLDDTCESATIEVFLTQSRWVKKGFFRKSVQEFDLLHAATLHFSVNDQGHIKTWHLVPQQDALEESHVEQKIQILKQKLEQYLAEPPPEPQSKKHNLWKGF